MLLFSRFSSSSSLHLANDLGIADSLLYRKPKRFMLDRLPGTNDKSTVSIHLNRDENDSKGDEVIVQPSDLVMSYLTTYLLSQGGPVAHCAVDQG